MKNIVCQAIILGIVSSLTTAEYSGSNGGDGSKSSGGYSKPGFISSYNSGYVGEYAGQLGAEKALGELQRYSNSQSQIAPEHGSQYNEEESRYNGGYGQNDGGRKYTSNQYDGFSGNLDLSKFPIDVEAHHYTGGGGSSDIGLGEEEDHQEDHQQNQQQEQNQDHQQEQHQYAGQRDYQSDDDGGQKNKQHIRPYNPYEKPLNQQYKGYNDHVSMLIVPYSGYEEAEEHGEQPSQYSEYGNAQHSFNQEYESPKAPSLSYSPSYESPKAPSSYSSSYDSPKEPSSTYGSPYESAKTPSPSYSPSYESPKAPSSYSSSYDSPKEQSPTYGSSYESAKTPSPSYSPSYESPKAPSSYSSSYDSPKEPSSTYGSSYESAKAPSPTPEHDYSSGSSGSYESHGVKYQQLAGPSTEAPSKSLNIIQNIKSAGLKNFHTSLHKNIMTIDHGKGSFSYSSLYRS